MILSCSRCGDSLSRGAQYQNATYGDGKRVHNPTETKTGTDRVYRCTVCGAERTKKGN